MPKYNIEESVEFSSTENKVTSILSGEAMELSLIASMLLNMLLSRQGQVVTRDDIFNTIFDKHGAASTNNNLNQYILNLRKVFHYLECDSEIIQTVPRLGFIVPQGIKIKVKDTLQGGKTRAPAHDDNAAPVERRIAGRVSCTPLTVYTTLISCLLLAAIAWFYRHSATNLSWFNVPNVKLVSQPLNGSCVISLLPSNNLQNGTILSNKFLERYMADKDCTTSQSSQFFFSENRLSGNKTRTFVLQCFGNMNDNPQCISHYHSEER